MTNQNEEKSRKPLYIGLIVVLVLINAFLAFNYWSNTNENRRVTAEKVQVDSLYNVVLADLNEQQQELTRYRTDNEELNTLIQEREAEIERQKVEIENILKKSNASQRELERAQRMIKKLVAENKKYLTQIETMQADIDRLTEETVRLTADLDTERVVTAELQSERERLSRKVEVGSLFRPSNFVGEGIRARSSGKESSTNRAKRAEKLKFCFDIDVNKVVDEGEQELYLRVVTPEGSTMAVQSAGSGIFTATNGDEIQYTKRIPFNYNHQSKRLCTYWEQEATLPEGKYKAILYQQGHEIANTDFTLK